MEIIAQPKKCIEIEVQSRKGVETEAQLEKEEMRKEAIEVEVQGEGEKGVIAEREIKDSIIIGFDVLLLL